MPVRDRAERLFTPAINGNTREFFGYELIRPSETKVLGCFVHGHGAKAAKDNKQWKPGGKLHS